MSGDFEPWNNSPAEHQLPKHIPPKTSYDYWQERRREQVRAVVKILAAIAILTLGILWYHGWRP
jgi:hypothetical protein